MGSLLRGLTGLTRLSFFYDWEERERSGFEGKEVSDAHARFFAAIISDLTYLESLSLGGSNYLRFTEADTRCLMADALRGLTKLYTLDLHGVTLDTKAARSLCGAITALPRQRHLKMGQNGLDADGTTVVAEAIRGLSTLEYLTIHSRDSEHGSAILLAKSARRGVPSCKVQILPENRFWCQ